MYVLTTQHTRITRNKESGSTESLASHFLSEAHFKGELPNWTKPNLQMYVKPENDIYPNRKITNTA